MVKFTKEELDEMNKVLKIYYEPYPIEKLKTTMLRVSEDRAGRYLPAKLIGAIMKPRGKK